MFLEFNTGYYKQGLVITDRSEIFWNYFSRKFIYDLLLNICWLISLSQDVSIWFKTIGVLRIIVVLYLINEIEETFRLRELFGSYFDLFKLGSFIFVSAHLIGCCWYALAIHERNLGITNTWLDRDIQNYDIEQVVNATTQGYIASFYWSIVTMCTVGYGDIGPTTYRERIFVMVVVILSSFIFGFSMNAIGDIIRNLRENSELFKQQMAVLNIYMKKRLLNKQLQSKVRRYYEYLYIERKENNEQGQELIENLAPFLRDEVQKDIYTNMFKKMKLFSLNFSSKLITELYKIIKEKKYGVDEFLYKEGEQSDKLFLILQGEVQIILQDRVILQTLRQGTFIGQIEFFSDKKYQFSCKTTKFTQIAIIEKKEFLRLLNYRKEDFESFQQMRDNVLSYQNTSRIEHQCESCGKYGHMFDSCQLIKLFSNKHRQIYEYNSLKQVNRSNWIRSRQTKQRREFTQTMKSVQNFVSVFNAKLLFQQQQLQQQENQDYEFNNMQSDDEIDDVTIQEMINDEKFTPIMENEKIQNIQNSIEKKNFRIQNPLASPTTLQDKNNSSTPINSILKIQEKDKQPVSQPRKSVFKNIINPESRKNGITPILPPQLQNDQNQGGSQTTKIEKILLGIQNFDEATQIKFAYDKEVEDGFDIIKEYTKYFPNNNAKDVIKQVNSINKRNQIYSKKIRQRKSEKTRRSDMESSRREMIHKRLPSYQKFYLSSSTYRKPQKDDHKQNPNTFKDDLKIQEENSFYTDNKQLLQP